MIANIAIASPPRIATRSASCGETGMRSDRRPAGSIALMQREQSGLSPPVV